MLQILLMNIMRNYHCLLVQVLIISLLAHLRSQESLSVLPEMQKKMSESNCSRVD